MKKAFLAAVVFAVPAFASNWTAETGHAKAYFSAKHMMLSTVTGEAGTVAATLNLDDKDVTKSKVDATVDLNDLKSGVEKRDQHLKSPDFFDVAKFPKMTFKSTKVEKAGEKLKVTGDLTIKDKTKPVTLDVEVLPEVMNPFSKQATRGFVATGKINREDWGLTWNMPLANGGVLVSKDIDLRIETEFVKAEPAAAKK
ncbi:MAG: YceI family protein [Myxococcaceae bacterium]